MNKYFNITGLCVKEKHYMADIADKVHRMAAMVDRGDYFIISRPRQYGKTTVLHALSQALSGTYLVIKTSFEGVGDDLFRSEEELCNNLFGVWSDSIRFTDKETAAILQSYDEITSFRKLSNAISDFIVKTQKKVVLVIDEVDKSSNSRVFLQFLGLLRKKYLSAATGEDITFQSVVLAGVHDIRTLKLAIRDENDARFNSPWNIAAKFDVDMSLSAEEIESMLLDYQAETGRVFDTKGISELIHQFTSGYPYLVSDICKTVDERLEAVWTDESVYSAVRMILYEKNTLFESVIKNIENNEDIGTVIEELLVQGKRFEYHPMVHEKGLLYGIFKPDGNRLAIHNSIFETYVYTYLVGKRELKRQTLTLSTNDERDMSTNNGLCFDKILLKFQDFMFEEFRQRDEKFYESQARLIFLAYLKPILNGRGFYFVEPQTRENKRMDVVVIYGREKYVVELKIWNGEKAHEKGREQLAEYLRIQNLNKGYLMVFNFNRNKEKSAEWVEVSGKELFEVIV